MKRTELQFLTTLKPKSESLLVNLNSVQVLNTKSAPELTELIILTQQASKSKRFSEYATVNRFESGS